jgi:hypothetical protein
VLHVATPQSPETHVSLLRHVTPQSPQLFGSESRSTHEVPQQVPRVPPAPLQYCPCVAVVQVSATHVLFTQESPLAQTVPQRPQLLGSAEVSVHPPPGQQAN